MLADNLIFRVPGTVRRAAKKVLPGAARGLFHRHERNVRHLYNMYRHHVEMSDRPVRGRLHGLMFTAGSMRRRKKVFCYPQLPRPAYVLHKIILQCGYLIAGDPEEPFDVAIHWELGTYTPADAALARLAEHTNVINIEATDVSKSHVGEVFGKTFGYALAVDPRKHEGACVKKSEENHTHDGEVVFGPIKNPEAGYAYQRLVDNETEEGLVEDIRVPVFGGKVPFVYVRHKPVDERFDSGRRVIIRARIAEAREVFSEEELERIGRFCSELGLDYGELDVLRDRKDERIYIVDANNTPGGPSGLTRADRRVAIDRLSRAFEEAFATTSNGSIANPSLTQ